jgi:hypothetical protein
MAQRKREPAERSPAPQGKGRQPAPQGRLCTVCGIKLSSYNPGPNCWAHTIGYPWRGPSAKPRF